MANGSHTFRNIGVLTTLGEASKPVRLQIIGDLTASELEGIAEVSRCIHKRSIGLRRKDRQAFRDRHLLLRLLASHRVQDERKRRLLVINHSILSRVLRRCYIRRTIGYFMRAH